MPETHDSEPFVWRRGPLIVSCEPVFWHAQRYPRRRVAPARPPLTERAVARELEQPYRDGHARIVRIPLTRRAVVVGYWLPAGEAVLAEEEGAKLLAAVEGVQIEGVTAIEISEWAPAADVVQLWDRLRLAWRRFWDRPVFRDRPVHEGDLATDLDGWEADHGWSLKPWSGMPDDDPVLTLDDARHDRIEPV